MVTNSPPRFFLIAFREGPKDKTIVSSNSNSYYQIHL
jgi:hypothetical protein